MNRKFEITIKGEIVYLSGIDPKEAIERELFKSVPKGVGVAREFKIEIDQRKLRVFKDPTSTRKVHYDLEGKIDLLRDELDDSHLDTETFHIATWINGLTFTQLRSVAKAIRKISQGVGE